MPNAWYALSVKQPWAALLLAGVKSIEIRSWPTRIRGPVLLHAGKKPDQRREGWDWIVTEELRESASLLGGIVGVVDLEACVAYRTAREFQKDQERHRVPLAWYAPPRMYGFTFRNPRRLPFREQTGQTFFFKVEGVELS